MSYKLVITAHYDSVYGYEDSHSVSVTPEEFDAVYSNEAAYRWSGTVYMSSLEDETCARLTGTSVVNCYYTIRKHHNFRK